MGIEPTTLFSYVDFRGGELNPLPHFKVGKNSNNTFNLGELSELWYEICLFNPLGVRPWGQLGCQKKLNCTINSNLWSFCYTFDLKIEKKNVEKLPKT